MNPKHPVSLIPASAGLLVLVLTLALVIVKVNSNTVSQNQIVSTRAAEDKVEILISPDNGTYDFNSEIFYPVGVTINSSGKTLTDVSVQIKFDPKKVSVDPKMSATTVFEDVTLSQVDNANGLIAWKAHNVSPKEAAGILFTFRLKALQRGEVILSQDTLAVSEDSPVVTKLSDAHFSFQ